MRRVVFRGPDGTPYLRRWVLVERTKRRPGIYLHRFVADDWSEDLHDHSSRFLSVGLWGSYEEVTPSGRTMWRAPWARGFAATHRHRIVLRSPTVWTICVAWPPERKSGFWVDGRFRAHEQHLARLKHRT